MIVGQLCYNNIYNKYYVDNYELKNGDLLEVLIYNGLIVEWIRTHIQHSDFWYLDGVSGYNLNGLFVRLNDVDFMQKKK